MTRDPNHPRTRELLRQYLLGTLSTRKRAALDAALGEDPALRDALDAERARLDTLDALPAAEPRGDLAGNVMRALDDDRPAGRLFRRRNWRVEVLAAAAVVALVVFAVIPAMQRAQETGRNTTAQNVLKQWGIVFKMYAGENRDMFPPVVRRDGLWVPDLSRLYPDFVNDPALLVSPRHPEHAALRERLDAAIAQDPVPWDAVHTVMAESFAYTGHAVTTQEEAERLVADAGDSSPPPLREGVERFFITDINNPAGAASSQAVVPVMFEVVPPGATGTPGVNVLYMDGHVTFVPWGEAFPATPDALRLFAPED